MSTVQAVEIRVPLSKSENQIWGLEFELNDAREIQVRNIIPNTPASFSDVEIKDVLMNVNGKNVSQMTLEETAAYFKNAHFADLVFRRQRSAPQQLQQAASNGGPTTNPSAASSREVIDLADDDDDEEAAPIVPRPQPVRAESPRGVAPAPSSGRQAQPVTADPRSTSTNRPEVIDLLSSSEDEEEDEEEDEDMSVAAMMAARNRITAAAAAAARSNTTSSSASIGNISNTTPSSGGAVQRQPSAAAPVAAPTISGNIYHSYVFGSALPPQHVVPPIPRHPTTTITGVHSGGVPPRPPAPSFPTSSSYGGVATSMSTTSRSPPVGFSTPATTKRSIDGAHGPNSGSGSASSTGKTPYSNSSNSSSSIAGAAAGGGLGQQQQQLPPKKRIKVGGIEIKLEREPLVFGAADSDWVTEVRDPNAMEAGEAISTFGGGSSSISGGGSGLNGSNSRVSLLDGANGSSVATGGEEENDDDDDFVQIVGSNMKAASDMPHQREACSQYPFGWYGKNPQLILHNISKCNNCYCYVCDINARECREWSEHCHATHKEGRWKVEKEARNSAIMKLMTPCGKCDFFAAHKAYLSLNNSKNALGIRRFYGGGGGGEVASSGGGGGGSSTVSLTTNMASSSLQPSGSGGTGTLKVGQNLSVHDWEMASGMISVIGTKFAESGSGSGSNANSYQQTFLEGAALLLKLLTTPSFPAWELDALPPLFLTMLLHPACSKEVRGIFREEVKVLLVSRTVTGPFRQLVRLLEVADLGYVWLQSSPQPQSGSTTNGSGSIGVLAASNGAANGAASAKRDIALPNDVATLLVEPIVSLLFQELARQGRFEELWAILEQKKDNLLRLKAAYWLLELGGGYSIGSVSSSARTLEIAVDIVGTIDGADFWSTCFSANNMSSPDGRVLFMKLGVDKLMHFIATLMDLHLGAGSSFRFLRAEGCFEAFLQLLLTRLFAPLTDGDLGEVTSHAKVYCGGAQPPEKATVWLGAVGGGKALSSLSKTQLAGASLVLFLIYIRRRLVVAKATSLSDVRALVATHVEKCVSGASTTLCLGAGSALLTAGWGYASGHSQLINAIDMALLCGGEVYKKVLSAASFQGEVTLEKIHPRVREDWRRLPTISKATAAVLGSSPALGATAVALAVGNKCVFQLDSNQQQQDPAGKGIRLTLITVSSPREVLPLLLCPRDLSAYIQLFAMLGSGLKYGSIYYLVRHLVKGIITTTAPTGLQTFSLFMLVDLHHHATLQMIWKGFLVNSHTFLLDRSPDAANKYTMLYDFVAKVRELLLLLHPQVEQHLGATLSLLLEEWCTKAEDTSSASNLTMRQSALLCINLACISLLALDMTPTVRISQLSIVKRFLLRTVPAHPMVADALHAQYLLGHLVDSRREVWIDFWCPFLRLLRPKLVGATTPDSLPVLNILLEDWDGLKAVPSGVLLQKLGSKALSAEDFHTLVSSAPLVERVEVMCAASQDNELFGRISELALAAGENSMLRALVRRLSAATLSTAAKQFHPLFVLTVRERRFDQATVEGSGGVDGHVAFDAVSQHFSTMVPMLLKATAAGGSGKSPANFERMVQSCAYLGRFDLVETLLAHGFAACPAKAKLLCETLVHCESQEVLEGVLVQFDTQLAACYTDTATPAIMQPLLDKYSAATVSGPALLLLRFYHCYDETSFVAYWSAVPHNDVVDAKIAAFLVRMCASPRLNTRAHFQIMRAFIADAEDFGEYLSTLNLGQYTFDKEEAVLLFGEMITTRSDNDLAPALYLVMVKFLLSMSTIAGRVREMLATLNRDALRALLRSPAAFKFDASLDKANSNNNNGSGSSSANSSSSNNISLSLALNLLLFIVDPSAPESLASLKASPIFRSIKGRIYALFRDFSHPAPIISLLLQDGEFGALMDFLNELVTHEKDTECDILCAAIAQLANNITAQSIVPRNEVPCSPGRGSKPSAEQCHKEFCRPKGLIRLLGGFVALAAEKANWKDLSAPLFGANALRIEAALEHLTSRLFDLVSFDMLLFNYLKLCARFNAPNILAFTEEAFHHIVVPVVGGQAGRSTSVAAAAAVHSRNSSNAGARNGAATAALGPSFSASSSSSVPMEVAETSNEATSSVGSPAHAAPVVAIMAATAKRAGSGETPLSLRMDRELKEDNAEEEEQNSRNQTPSPSSAEEDRIAQQPVTAAELVDSILHYLLEEVKSNYVSDATKLDELLSAAASRALTHPVPCLREPATLDALVHRVLAKPCWVDDTRPFATGVVTATKGMLWIPSELCVSGHKNALTALLKLVTKHKQVAARALEVPLFSRLDHSTITRNATNPAAPLSVTLSLQLKNPTFRELVRGGAALNPECRIQWTGLTTVFLLTETFSIDTILPGLVTMTGRSTYAPWLSILSAIATSHILHGTVSMGEILRAIFSEFIGPGGIQRNLFGPDLTADILSHCIINKSVELKRELANGARSLHSRNHFLRYPALLRFISVDLVTVLYEYQSYLPLWEEYTGNEEVKGIFAPLLLEAAGKVFQHVAAERLSARVKMNFEEFLSDFRRCFSRYGPGANALLQAAKTSGRSWLKTKPVAMKMLATLDTPLDETLVG